MIAPKGLCHVGRLAGLVDEAGGALPELVRRLCGELLDLITVFNGRIGALDREVRERARADELARRLMTIRGVGPVTALALSVLAPPSETFKCGRDLAAWIGLTPRIATAAAFERRGQPAGEDFEDGPARSSAAADHRRQRRGALGTAAGIGGPPGA